MMPRMLLATMLCGVLSGLPAMARDLTVVGRGRLLQQAQQEIYFKPFEASTGTSLDTREWAGGISTLRIQIESGSNDWDVLLVSAAELLAGCEDGLFEKLNWTTLGGRDKFLPQTTTDCGEGSAISSLVLAWDRDKFPAMPSWADFWDVARYPGKRGLRRGARSNLEFALMADGVAPGDVYRLLRTSEGVDRAFRKLDQIKPYLVWWTQDAPAGQILESGEVLLSTTDSVSVGLANRTSQRHFGVQWTGSLYNVLSWVIMKGSPNLADGMKLLASMADPAKQAAITTAVPYGPTVKGANDLLPPEIQATSPSAPPNLANALQMDEQFWRDNGEKLNQRFDAWLVH